MNYERHCSHEKYRMEFGDGRLAEPKILENELANYLKKKKSAASWTRER